MDWLHRICFGPGDLKKNVLVMDNQDYHVSNESIDLVVERLGSKVCPLLANSTLYCQLLDVGVMGPLKRLRFRAFGWLRKLNKGQQQRKGNVQLNWQLRLSKRLVMIWSIECGTRFIFLTEQDNTLKDNSNIAYNNGTNDVSKKDSKDKKDKHSEVLVLYLHCNYMYCSMVVIVLIYSCWIQLLYTSIDTHCLC